MKKLGLLLLMSFLFTGMYAKTNWRPMWHRMAEPVKIDIRHIDFFIFPNGEFDFNAQGRRYRYAGYRGVRIERDHFGKIRRVGNVYLNYNRYGQVSRIGQVFIKYNRRGLVERIGRKRIHYNRRGYYVSGQSWGYPGFVAGVDFYYGPSQNYEYEPYDEDQNYNYDDEEDGDNYYYRQPEPGKKDLKVRKHTKNRRR